jgi:hypothetical protein
VDVREGKEGEAIASIVMKNVVFDAAQAFEFRGAAIRKEGRKVQIMQSNQERCQNKQ